MKQSGYGLQHNSCVSLRDLRFDGLWLPNYKRVKGYGCPSKGDPKGGISTVQSETFLQNAEIVTYVFLRELYDNENGLYHVAPYSTSGKWDAIKRGARFTKSISRQRNRVEKTSEPWKGIQWACFGYETIWLRHIAVIFVYLRGALVLTGCSSHKSKRAKCYGCRSKSDLKGGTSTVQDATFLQNAKLCRTKFLSEHYANKNGFYHGALHSTSGKWDAIN